MLTNNFCYAYQILPVNQSRFCKFFCWCSLSINSNILLRSWLRLTCKFSVFMWDYIFRVANGEYTFFPLNSTLAPFSVTEGNESSFLQFYYKKNTFQHDTERLCAIKKTKMYNPFSSGLQYTLTPLISLAG